jgi:hypothetical protein
MIRICLLLTASFLISTDFLYLLLLAPFYFLMYVCMYVCMRGLLLGLREDHVMSIRLTVLAEWMQYALPDGFDSGVGRVRDLNESLPSYYVSLAGAGGPGDHRPHADAGPR